MSLIVKMNIRFFCVRLGPGAIVIKKTKQGIITNKCTGHIYRHESSIYFQQEARAVTVRELGMIQRAAGRSSAWTRDLSQIPLWTSTVLDMSEQEAKRIGTEYQKRNTVHTVRSDWYWRMLMKERHHKIDLHVPGPLTPQVYIIFV